MKLYHGSNQEIIKPLHNGSREKTDFGKGFYLTQDKNQAQRWSIRDNTPIVNCYNLELEVLQTYEFKLGLEWLLFMKGNLYRGDSEGGRKWHSVVKLYHVRS